jgi:hypothetical protein
MPDSPCGPITLQGANPAGTPTRRGLQGGALGNIRRGFGSAMPHYYFDIRENDKIAVDELGLDLPDLQTAAVEAAQSLADMARDMLPAARCYSLGIDVRIGDEPLFKAAIAYELKRR